MQKDEIKEINIKIPGQILDYVDTKEHLLELFEYITNLQEENRQTKLLKERYQLEKEDYKSRNKKAIEYIKQHQVRISIAGEKELGFCNEFDIFSSPIILLNILQGEDKDVKDKR